MKTTSLFPFSIDKNASKYFMQRVQSIFRLDEVRVMQILEITQYSIIYFVLGFMLGAGLEIIFPDFDENMPIENVIIEVLAQLVLFVVLVFYVRKIAKLIPFLFVLNWDLNGDGKIPKYKPYLTAEYSGEITIGLVLIGSQLNFLRKIDLLSREMYSRYMGLPTRIGSIIGDAPTSSTV
jgi:hypothetical protein